MEDKFAAACGMLAVLLPPAQVFITRAGHDWSSWRPIWDAILKSKLLSQTAPENGGDRWEVGHGAASPQQ